MYVPFADGKPNGKPVEVLTGFVDKNGDALGRPVGVAIDKAGALLVADDVGNVVWRVTPGGTLIGCDARSLAHHHHEQLSTNHNGTEVHAIPAKASSAVSAAAQSSSGRLFIPAGKGAARAPGQRGADRQRDHVIRASGSRCGLPGANPAGLHWAATST